MTEKTDRWGVPIDPVEESMEKLGLQHSCSFCGKRESEIEVLVSGPHTAVPRPFICDECVRLAMEVVAKTLARDQE